MRSTPLQRILFRNLLLGPLILGIAVFLVLQYSTRQMQLSIAEELTGRAIAQVDTAVAGYLQPVAELAQLGVNLGKAGRLDSTDTEILDPVFGALLDAVTQISSVHVATADGREYMMLAEPDGSYYNRISSVADPGWIIERRWPGVPRDDAEPSTARVPSDYRAGERPWFTEALANHEPRETARGDELDLVWSEPYTFFTTGDPGITASVAYQRANGAVEVLAFDILLTDIQRFAEEIALGESGMLVVTLRQGDSAEDVVLALPADISPGGADAFPLPASQMSGPPRDYFDMLAESAEGDQRGAYRFSSGGQNWWGATASSPLSSEKEIWITAVVPEAEVMSGIPNTSQLTLGVLVLTVILMIWRARVLAQRYGQTFGQLVAQTERFARLNFSRLEKIESPIHEVQMLATSQEVMGRSLAALTEMNDRDAIARDLRKLPEDERLVRSGRVSLAICDEPASKGGGTFLFGLPGGMPDTAIAVVAATALGGMRAAQVAPALRAVARGAGSAGDLDVDTMARTIASELTDSAGVAAPFDLAVCEIDGDSGALRFAGQGRAIVLRKAAGGSCFWTEATLGDSQTLDIEAGDLLLLAAPDLFDLLDSERRPLERARIEEWLADDAGDLETLRDRIAAAIRDFGGDQAGDRGFGFMLMHIAD